MKFRENGKKETRWVKEGKTWEITRGKEGKRKQKKGKRGQKAWKRGGKEGKRGVKRMTRKG